MTKNLFSVFWETPAAWMAEKIRFPAADDFIGVSV